MDFDLPEELQLLKRTVRRFVDNELIPLEREYRHDGLNDDRPLITLFIDEMHRAAGKPHAML